RLIGGALVGTFLGVFLSYCLLTPIYTAISQYLDSKGKLMLCIKTALISHMQGLPPIISVEAARKTIPGMFRPSFAEVEEKMNETPA
ncbi:MAG: flagellar motor stator protein MotA, partial [Anaplasmataceae bacterium]|nr:flagellar motor stator protein MotA [Anaplasmataceae bacterium]